jgi:WD40 repeat protein
MEVPELDGLRSSAGSLAMFEDKLVALVSASMDHSILVWNLEGQEVKKELVGHTGAVLAMVVTASGQRLFSSSADQTLRVWSLATGVCEQPQVRPSALKSWPSAYRCCSGDRTGSLCRRAGLRCGRGI